MDAEPPVGVVDISLDVRQSYGEALLKYIYLSTVL